MKCDEARILLMDRQRASLDGALADRLAAHLTECADCRHLRKSEEILDETLARLPRKPAPESLRAFVAIQSKALSTDPLPANASAESLPPQSHSVESSQSRSREAPKSDRLKSRAVDSKESISTGAADDRPSDASHSDASHSDASHSKPSRPDAWQRPVRAALIVAALAASVFLLVRFVGTGAGDDSLVREAVNDHLRVLYSDRPPEIASGGIHQVKPWFAGRLDFAPSLAFEGDDEFVLTGGSIGYVIDRKAAVFSFKHKLHQISLFMFRAEGISWPVSNDSIGRARSHIETSRGFHSITWRDGDLGYALVSDVDAAELHRLAERIVDPPASPN